MKFLRPLILLALVLLCLPAGAQSAAVDKYVRTEMEKRHIPGLSLGVVKAGKVIKAKGYGYANLELKVPATPDSVYKIGSISKQFIACGIVFLAEEGKLSYEDKISKYLEGTPPTWKNITIRHLLTHTSGIVREAPGFNPLKLQPDADVVRTAYPLPMRFAPGEKWEYCNVGYFSLGEIIRKVSGKPWGDYLAEKMFTPLNLTSTRTTSLMDLVPNRASGYEWNTNYNRFDNAEIYITLRPSGALLSSVSDLVKWQDALLKGKVFSQATLNQMWTPVSLNDGKTYPYGFGWQLDDYRGHRQIRHGGSTPGFRSEMTRFVDDDLTVIVLVNLDGGGPTEIAHGVAAFYIPDLKKKR